MTKQNIGSNGPGEKKFGGLDYLKITIFGFALTALWSSLGSILLPIRILAYVPEAQKNTYLGLLTFAGLIVAIIVQPVAGTFSDFTRSRWGRRRPYILLGMLFSLIMLPGIGLATTYIALFIPFCLLSIFTNTAQASYQAFIPELVPPDKRGLASGIKSTLEVLGGVALVRVTAYFMGHYFGGGGEYWMWIALGKVPAGLRFALPGVWSRPVRLKHPRRRPAKPPATEKASRGRRWIRIPPAVTAARRVMVLAAMVWGDC